MIVLGGEIMNTVRKDQKSLHDGYNMCAETNVIGTANGCRHLYDNDLMYSVNYDKSISDRVVDVLKKIGLCSVMLVSAVLFPITALAAIIYNIHEDDIGLTHPVLSNILLGLTCIPVLGVFPALIISKFFDPNKDYASLPCEALIPFYFTATIGRKLVCVALESDFFCSVLKKITVVLAGVCSAILFPITALVSMCAVKFVKQQSTLYSVLFGLMCIPVLGVIPAAIIDYCIADEEKHNINNMLWVASIPFYVPAYIGYHWSAEKMGFE